MEVPFFHELMVSDGQPLISNSHVTITDEPGFAIEFNEEVACEYSKPGESFFLASNEYKMANGIESILIGSKGKLANQLKIVRRTQVIEVQRSMRTMRSLPQDRSTHHRSRGVDPGLASAGRREFSASHGAIQTIAPHHSVESVENAKCSKIMLIFYLDS